ncbi:MAG: GNAT family N-acetyltransferase [Ardenticatenaceae bacterium]
MNIQPTTLTAYTVRLEPLSEAHVPDLAMVGQDESIWGHMLYGNVTTEAKMLLFVQDILNRQKKGNDLPFTVVELASGRAIGCTRYLNISRAHRSVEIGGTWYGLDYQRTSANTECKYVMLQHAFETWGCIRVQLKTDSRNLPSQRAIERLGAVKEGTLRNHIIKPDGTIRDSLFYSILDREWPAVKARLEGILANVRR